MSTVTHASEKFVLEQIKSIFSAIGANLQQVATNLDNIKADKTQTYTIAQIDSLLNNISALISAHTASSNVHVTDTQKQYWNSKADTDSIYTKEQLDGRFALKSDCNTKLPASSVVSPSSTSTNSQAASAKAVWDKFEEFRTALLSTLRQDDVVDADASAQAGKVAEAKYVYDNFAPKYFKSGVTARTLRESAIANQAIVSSTRVPLADFASAGTIEKIRLRCADNDIGIWTRSIKLKVYGLASNGNKTLISSSNNIAEMVVGNFATFNFTPFTINKDYTYVVFEFADETGADCNTRISVADTHELNGYAINGSNGVWYYTYAPIVEVVGTIEVTESIQTILDRFQQMKEVQCLNAHSTENQIIDRLNLLLNAIQGVNT